MSWEKPLPGASPDLRAGGMLDSQTLRERQSIVCLRFYFSDDVTLNTFRVPFVIFTSKNDAFLQTHFSPISHGLNGTSSAACLSGRVSGPWLSHTDPQEHLEYTDGIGHLVYPRCPFGSLPKSFAAGPENREQQFYRNKPQI